MRAFVEENTVNSPNCWLACIRTIQFSWFLEHGNAYVTAVRICNLYIILIYNTFHVIPSMLCLNWLTFWGLKKADSHMVNYYYYMVIVIIIIINVIFRIILINWISLSRKWPVPIASKCIFLWNNSSTILGIGWYPDIAWNLSHNHISTLHSRRPVSVFDWWWIMMMMMIIKYWWDQVMMLTMEHGFYHMRNHNSVLQSAYPIIMELINMKRTVLVNFSFVNIFLRFVFWNSSHFCFAINQSMLHGDHFSSLMNGDYHYKLS